MGAPIAPAAAAVLLAVLLSGCSNAPQAIPAAPAATSTPGPLAPAAGSSPYPTLGPQDVDSEDGNMLVDPEVTAVVPTWSPELHVAAIDAATTAITDWARPDLTYDQWWPGLAGHLTPGAQQTVVDTDPVNIPVTTVGAAVLPDEGATAYLAWVSFETNAGTWWVLVAWQGDGTWLADRITQSHEVTP